MHIHASQSQLRKKIIMSFDNNLEWMFSLTENNKEFKKNVLCCYEKDKLCIKPIYDV